MIKDFLKAQYLNPKLWDHFENAFSDFNKMNLIDEENEQKLVYRLKMNKYLEKKIGVKLPFDYMVFITFVYLKGFDYEYQPMEKILWEIPFNFKEHKCWFTKNKYGFELLIDSKNEEVFFDLFKKLNNAIKIADKLCSPLIKELINEGDVTLENQVVFIRNRYEYFKNNAEELFTSPVSETLNDISGYVSMMNKQNSLIQQASFNAQAMLDAYFSLQEHVMVLLLPFTKINSADITSFMREDWNYKFNKVFRPSDDPVLMRLYDNLKIIKEKYRNKSAHGEFEKNNGSMYAHMGILGAIPVQMSQFNKDFDFSFVSINDITFQDICKIIDGFEQYLIKSNTWKRPIKILYSGLDINYDKRSLIEYAKAIESDESTEEFIYYYHELQDRYTNMDW